MAAWLMCSFAAMCSLSEPPLELFFCTGRLIHRRIKQHAVRVTISRIRSNFTSSRCTSNFSTFITLEECNNKLKALKAQDEQKVTLEHCNADEYNLCSLQLTLLAQQLVDETAQKTAADWKDKAQVSSRCLPCRLSECVYMWTAWIPHFVRMCVCLALRLLSEYQTGCLLVCLSVIKALCVV